MVSVAMVKGSVKMVRNKKYKDLQERYKEADESFWRAKTGLVEHIRELIKANAELRCEIIKARGGEQMSKNTLKKLVDSLQTIEFIVKADTSTSGYTVEFDGEKYGDYIVVEGLKVDDTYMEVLNLQLKQLGGLLEALVEGDSNGNV